MRELIERLHQPQPLCAVRLVGFLEFLNRSKDIFALSAQGLGLRHDDWSS